MQLRRTVLPAPGPVVALNAHGDVVPPGEGWTHDPYGGEIVDGKLYGRAAAVSKSDFSTFVFATRALEAAGLKLAGGIVVSTEGEDTGEWVLVDCGDAVVHVLQPAIRAYYNLEEIWGGKEVRLKSAAPVSIAGKKARKVAGRG
jgi:acetylornithine deacetylase/succinyl-diaminopimelate desuccinylase-like protein